jgi:calcineurin-like phosphoesterase family protein
MSWFFASDWHLAHANIIKYCRRPFVTETEAELLAMADRGTIPATEVRISVDSAKLMTATIIDNTNAVVGENDTLVHLGDLLFAPRDELFERLRDYRKSVVCKNMILVWGNHDDALRDLYHNTGRYRGPQWAKASAETKAMFQGAYDQFMFNVNGQKIFCNHYPARSWDCAHHGAWMLYGHVHNLYRYEDNGELSPYTTNLYTNAFSDILKKYYGSLPPDEAVTELLAVIASQNGIDLTLDVGVDNVVRKGVAWGTPWSMEDLYVYMGNKKPKWEARSAGYAASRPKSTMKGDPKF